MRRVFALLGLSAALVVAWLSLFPAQAVATVEGPCTASIDNVNVTKGHDTPDGAVPLQSGKEVPVAGTAQSRVTDLTYTLHIAGGGVEVGSVVIAQDGLSWSGTVDLSTISNATVGLFETTATVETAGAPCTATAYVCIDGRSPFTTVAGIGATIVGLGGAILLVLSLVGARRTSLARSALPAFAGGAVAGLGGAVLLQQFCTLPLTAGTAIAVPVLVGVAGAIGASVLWGTGRGGPATVQPQPGRGAGAPTEPVSAPIGTGGVPAGTEGIATAPVSAAARSVGVDVGGPSATVEGPVDSRPAAAPPVLPPPPPLGAEPASPVEAAADRNCLNCGTANEADAVFCTNCGERLT